MTLRQLSVRPLLTAGVLARTSVQSIFGRLSVYGLPASLLRLRLGETIYHGPSPPAGVSDASLGAFVTAGRLLKGEAETSRANARRLLAAVEGTAGAPQVQGPEAGTPGWLRLPLLAADWLVGRLETREAAAFRVTPSCPRPLYRLPHLQEGLETKEAGPLGGAGRLPRSPYTLPIQDLLHRRDLRAIRRVLDGGSESDVGAGAGRHRDREPETGTPAHALSLAVLSAVSLAAYLAFSAAPRAFLKRASAVLATLLGLMG